jgi:hypothetical protein
MNEITAVEHGVSRYRIVLPARDDYHSVGRELQHFLRKITGVELGMITDRERIGEYEIILGNNSHLEPIGAQVDIPRLGDQGFTIRTVGNHLVIAAGTPEGTLNGIYSFLDDHLGCRFYSSTVQKIPRTDALRIGPIDDTQVPVLKWRSMDYYDTFDLTYRKWHKLNGNGFCWSFTEMHRKGQFANGVHTGKQECFPNQWGTWCHTFYELVPPERYFKEHPEYFSLVDGKRTHLVNDSKTTAQLCLTNPEVLKVTVENLREMIRLNPQAKYWSVGQMDGHWGACQCPECKALDEREGSQMGSVLNFVNQVAQHFPEKIISTLAYTYTIEPPKTLRPAKNVVIMLTTSYTTQDHPIETSPLTGKEWPEGGNPEFRTRLEKWKAAADQLFLFDYVVQCESWYTPFPNLWVQKPNIQYYLKNKGKGLVYCSCREPGGEFCELRAYLLAKLMWNPDADPQAIVNDFLQGFYGPAAGAIRRYIDMTHEALAQSGKTLPTVHWIERHRDGYLSEEWIRKYDVVLAEAEDAVRNDPELLKRVRMVRVSVWYIPVRMGYGSVAERRKLAEKLFAAMEDADYWLFSEVYWDPNDGPIDKFKAWVAKTLAEEEAKVAK